MGKGKVDKGAIHNTTMPLLEALYEEYSILSKKKPDATLSTQKIKTVNRLLVSVRQVLDSEAVIEYLDLLDEDDVPQVSDVVISLSQYVAAMKSFKRTYYSNDVFGDDFYWHL